jgi:hypothetical protein
MGGDEIYQTNPICLAGRKEPASIRRAQDGLRRALRQTRFTKRTRFAGGRKLQKQTQLAGRRNLPNEPDCQNLPTISATYAAKESRVKSSPEAPHARGIGPAESRIVCRTSRIGIAPQERASWSFPGSKTAPRPSFARSSVESPRPPGEGNAQGACPGGWHCGRRTGADTLWMFV